MPGGNPDEGWTMVENLLSEHLGTILGILGALLLAGVVFKISVNRKQIDRSTTVTDQSRSKVGGDQAGRDINKR